MHEPQDARPRATVAVRGGIPLPDLPRTRPALRRRAACAPWPSRPRRSCSSRSAPGSSCGRPDRAARVRPQPVRPRARSSCSTSSCSLYRLVAIVDAYRVAEFLNTSARRRATVGSAGRACRATPLSIAGLLAVVLVMTGSHVGRRPLRHARAWTSSRAAASSSATRRNRSASVDADAVARPDGHAEPGSSALPTDTPEPEATPIGGALPEVSVPPWDGKERLNILLIGADQRPKRRHLQHRHADRRLDRPASPSRSPCSACRATPSTCPIPPGPARQAFGLGLSRQDQRLVHQRSATASDLFPGTERTRGYNGLKAILGNLYEPRHQVLRRGQLRGLRSGRRRAGRGDDQRPGPGRRRPLSRRATAGSSGSTSRAGSST